MKRDTADGDNDPSLTKKKRQSSFTAPILQEIREIREANNSFKSTAMAFEMNDLLQMIHSPVSEKARNFLFNVKRVLEQEEEGEGELIVTQEDCEEWFEDYEFTNEGMKLTYLKPKTVHVIGSLLLNNVRKPEEQFDLCVQIPSQCLRKEDRLNYGYHDKRVLYLGGIAKKLKALKGCSFRSELFCDDPRKPLLVFQKKTFVVKVYVSFSNKHNKIPVSKLLPHVDETPHYNSSIAEDTQLVESNESLMKMVKACPVLVRASLLVKHWIARNNLDGHFNGYHCMMLLGYLFENDKISANMTEFVIFRAFLSCVSDSSLFEKGLFWNAAIPETLKESFNQHFEVVFVDELGVVNIFSRVTKCVLQELQNLCASTLNMMDSWNTSLNFSTLFVNCPSFDMKWDVLFKISLSAKVKQESDYANYYGWRKALMVAVTDVLKEGFKTRCETLSHRLRDDENEIVIGMTLNASNAFRKLDAGPPANDKERAAKFRKFWGSRAELRRFKDGSIIESVVWECNFDERQLIPQRIAEHLLSHHFGLNDVVYYATQTDGLLSLSNPFNAGVVSGDAQALHIGTVFQELADKIRDLEKVPLPVNDIWPIHSVFRSCCVFPPSANAFLSAEHKAEETLVMEPLTFLVQYGNSGAWPDHVHAIQHLKLAFQLKSRAELFRMYQIRSEIRAPFLDITYKGYVFRLAIYLSKEHRLSEGEEKIGKLNTKGLAVHTSSISGFHMKHNAYGTTVRLCKRWLSAHLLSDKISETFVELSVLHLFCSPYPYNSAPAVPMFGFLRWLRLLASYPWSSEPLIVSVNERISDQTLVKGKQKMETRRNAHGPFVISEYDMTSQWTKELPSAMIWKRITALAKSTLTVEVSGVLSLFVHNYEDYDFVIHLDGNHIPLMWQNITHRITNTSAKRKSGIWSRSTRGKKLSEEFLVDFHPVKCFVQECEQQLGEIAVFFYDEHGGDKVGGVFRKHTNNSVICAKPIKQNVVEINRPQFYNRIRSIGKNLVLSIKT